jgi:hypothetical protein
LEEIEMTCIDEYKEELKKAITIEERTLVSIGKHVKLTFPKQRKKTEFNQKKDFEGIIFFKNKDFFVVKDNLGRKEEVKFTDIKMNLVELNVVS